MIRENGPVDPCQPASRRFATCDVRSSVSIKPGKCLRNTESFPIGLRGASSFSGNFWVRVISKSTGAFEGPKPRGYPLTTVWNEPLLYEAEKLKFITRLLRLADVVADNLPALSISPVIANRQPPAENSRENSPSVISVETLLPSDLLS